MNTELTLNKADIFYKKLAQLDRDELLDLLRTQSLDLYKQVDYIEEVFRTKLTHLNWSDGTPVLERPFTNEELALLIDQPFEVDEELTKLRLSVQEQRNLHYAKDPILWAKHYLKAQPRVYQILIVREPRRFKVLRSGRRLGKTWSMAVLLLHYAFTTKNGNALVVTPMKTQAGLIYDEILKLAKESDIVNDAITRSVRSPQNEIDFTNGSAIRFFTSGMKTGAKADITRGQEASLIVLDELDYMGDDDLEALLAMLQQTQETQLPKRMIGASTPSGRRGVFWKWCHGRRFREYWFPSYCNPLWKEDDEELFREEYSETGYRHEIEADWGEDAESVYPRRFLDLAFKEPGWKYTKDKSDLNSIYVCGVDWDKYGAGVNIVVLEKMPLNHAYPELSDKVRLCYREEMHKDEYAFLKAVDHIIFLDKIFNFKHLYIDAGSGEMQWEALRKYGVDNPRSGFADKTRRVAFAESIEVRDPWTMQKIKKQVKPFMVDNLRQMLEREKLIISGDDEELYMQLISYVVARTSITGTPVFEINAPNVQDHAHDALILAAFAITENYGDLMYNKYATKSFVVSNEVFQPTLELSSDPSERALEEELIKDKWGSKNAAPVQIRRSMTYNRRRGTNFRRKMF